ncbi:MAG TPA: 5-amino-6-(D-ribitylamino)uracil--L-tyrosine 4-hydroxyphenyl transferase CofH [Acidimicrobiia bacterium]|nr:5-amino-6-(D-ribitylamino)uracil--L-tyrosine 4-hydroxyphenyl transferase CofH [Acidimicrobiia bacterium]
MKPVTFVRSRPAENINQISAATRRREGTTVLELEAPDPEAVVVAAAERVLVTSASVAHPAAAHVIHPAEASAIERAGVCGWRITVVAGDTWEPTLDAVARLSPAFVRVGRSAVGEWRKRLDLPGLEVTLSVFVDDVAQAVAAVGAGAGDLILRDWSGDRVGELRDALSSRGLVERSVFGLGIDIDTARSELAAEVFTAWLGQVDGSGAVRPRYSWAPGKDEALPVPERRLSAEWSDAIWTSGTAPAQLAGAGELRPILERSLAGTPPTVPELERLFSARGDQVDAVAWVADALRQRTSGDDVSYVVNRNINYTNMCYFRCGFCAFSKGPRSLNLRGDPYLMGIPEIVERSREAAARGATEVTLQGGIHPEFTGDFYVGVVEAIKAELPDMHIHGFTPLEVWQGAQTLGVGVRDFLGRLHAAGLGSLPGTAAEILDDDVRRHLCPDKIRTAQWAEVMLTAHDLGLRATATVMFGHIDHPRSWANHYEVIRTIQRRTGGFTEFVPLPFVHMGSPIFLRGLARPGPTWDETVLIHAVARLAFDGLIDNIQASWVKLGLDGGARLLGAGCNDLGGTLMGEIITRSAGAAHGQEMTPAEFEEAILAAGRRPVRRNTVYARLS